MDRQQTTLTPEQRQAAIAGPVFVLQFLVDPSYRQTVRVANRELAEFGDSAMLHRFHDLLWTLREPEVIALLTDDEKAALAEFNTAFGNLLWREIEEHPHINELPGHDFSPLLPSAERLYSLLEARARADEPKR